MSSGAGVRGRRRRNSRRDKPAPEPHSLPARAAAGAERGLQCTTATAHARRPLAAPGAGPGTLAPLATVAPQPAVRLPNGRGAQETALDARSPQTDAMRPSLTPARGFSHPVPVQLSGSRLLWGTGQRGMEMIRGRDWIFFFFFFAVVNSAFQNAPSIRLKGLLGQGQPPLLSVIVGST